MKESERENGFQCLLLFHSLLFPPSHIRLCCSIHFWYIIFLQSSNLFIHLSNFHHGSFNFFFRTDHIFETEPSTGRALLQAKKGDIFVMLFSITVGNYVGRICLCCFCSLRFSNRNTNMSYIFESKNEKIMFNV